MHIENYETIMELKLIERIHLKVISAKLSFYISHEVFSFFNVSINITIFSISITQFFQFHFHFLNYPKKYFINNVNCSIATSWFHTLLHDDRCPTDPIYISACDIPLISKIDWIKLCVHPRTILGDTLRLPSLYLS